MPSLQNYANRQHINYLFLAGNDEIVNTYLNGDRGVPFFFILDENRVIKRIIKGYNLEHTGKEITQAIDIKIELVSLKKYSRTRKRLQEVVQFLSRCFTYFLQVKQKFLWRETKVSPARNKGFLGRNEDSDYSNINSLSAYNP